MTFLLLEIIVFMLIGWFLDHKHQQAIIKELKRIHKEITPDEMDEFELRALEHQEEDKYFPIHKSL